MWLKRGDDWSVSRFDCALAASIALCSVRGPDSPETGPTAEVVRRGDGIPQISLAAGGTAIIGGWIKIAKHDQKILEHVQEPSTT